MEIQEAIKKTAIKYGVTPDDLIEDIKEAIQAGMASDNPTVKENWRKISKNGREPTVEEVIAFLALEVKANL